MAGSNHTPLDANRAAIEAIAARAGKQVETYVHAKDRYSPGEKKLKDSLNPVQDALANLNHFAAGVLNGVSHAASTHNPADVIGQVLKFVSDNEKHIGYMLDPRKWNLEKDLEALGGPLIEALIHGSMGIDLEGKPHASAPAVSTIKRVAGFVIALEFGSAAFVHMGKLLLCERFPEAIAETIGKTGEELGFNWLLGTLFETIFEGAVGQPLEELINKQTHPRRFDMQTLRMLMRQHRIPQKDAIDIMDDLGWRKEDADKLILLDQNQLSMSDLATAYLNGSKTPDEVCHYLEHQGFSDDDIAVLIENYITKGETPGKAMYQSAARTAYREDQITEQMFRDILKTIGISTDAINMEEAAIALEKKTQFHALSIGTLKWMWQSDPKSHDAVDKELVRMRYSDGQIADIHEQWDAGPKTRHRELSPSKLVMFAASKVIDPETAIDRLTGMGFDNADATMWVNHPRTAGVTHTLPYNHGTVRAALAHEIIDATEARRELAALKIPDTEIDLEVSLGLLAQKTHKKKVVKPKTISEADMVWAIKESLVAPGTVLQYCEDVGYQGNDAVLMMTILYAKAKDIAGAYGMEPGFGAFPGLPPGLGHLPTGPVNTGVGSDPGQQPTAATTAGAGELPTGHDPNQGSGAALGPLQPI